MVETNAAGEKEERGDASGKAKTATTVRGGELRKRERKVRVMHVSRPLMGGLSWAPENAGELDMITVDKYTAVLKSYPGEKRSTAGTALVVAGGLRMRRVCCVF